MESELPGSCGKDFCKKNCGDGFMQKRLQSIADALE